MCIWSIASGRSSTAVVLALSLMLASCITDPHPTHINPREAVIAAAAAGGAPITGKTTLATSVKGVAVKMALYKYANQCVWKFDPNKDFEQVFHLSVLKALDERFAELASGPNGLLSAEEAAQPGRTVFLHLKKAEFSWASGSVAIDFRADLQVMDSGRSVLEREVVAKEAGVEEMRDDRVRMLWGIKEMCDQEAEWLGVAFQYGLKRIVEAIRREVTDNRDVLSGSTA